MSKVEEDLSDMANAYIEYVVTVEMGDTDADIDLHAQKEATKAHDFLLFLFYYFYLCG